MNQGAKRRALHGTWSEYLGRVAPELDDDDISIARSSERTQTPDFGALSAKATHARQQLHGGTRTSGVVDPTVPGILRRISDISTQLAEDPAGPAEELLQRLLVGRALAMGTDLVLLETEISLDGDVTTRVNQAWLEAENDGEDRMRAVLELQRMGVQTAVSWWSGLVDLVAKVGRDLIEMVLAR